MSSTFAGVLGTRAGFVVGDVAAGLRLDALDASFVCAVAPGSRCLTQKVGVLLAAHAVTDEAITRAVRAGVATIEHGTDASARTLTLMKEHGVVLCPTLAASEAMARYDGWTPGAPDHPRITAAREMFARALASGVTIACGSDVGVFPHGQNAREIELMVEYGMTPVRALRAATSTAARVLNRQNDLGTIAPGYIADLVALRDAPLTTPSTLRTPVLVIKTGRIVFDARKASSRP